MAQASPRLFCAAYFACARRASENFNGHRYLIQPFRSSAIRADDREADHAMLRGGSTAAAASLAVANVSISLSELFS